LEQVQNQFLEARAEDKCKAKPYQHTDERVDYCDGYQERSFATHLGKILFEVPRSYYYTLYSLDSLCFNLNRLVRITAILQQCTQ
jgi:transposase-like protein